MAWTEERVSMLTKLWADGLSASQIAAELGGVTRNAVIGKVHRLGLSGRAKGSNSLPRTHKTRSASSLKVGKKRNNRTTTSSSNRSNRGGAHALAYVTEDLPEHQAETKQDVVVPISKRLNILELANDTCRWPIGDPGEQGFHFCGNKCDAEDTYCTYHARVAYQSPNNRRRRAS